MKTRHLAAMVLANFLWASSDVAAKFAMDSYTPMTLSWLRITFAAVTVAVLFRSALWSTFKTAPWMFMAAGLTGYSLNFISFNAGLDFSSASHGAAIRPVEVLLVALLARLLLKEAVTYRVYLGAVLGAVGIYWIVSSNASSQSGGHILLGDLLMVAATFFDALYSIVCKFTVTAAAALRSVAAAVAVGWVSSSLFLAAPAVRELTGVPVAWPAMLASVYLGIFVTVVAYWLYARVLVKIDAHVAASTILLQPVFGVILAVLLLDEKITASFVIGALVVAGSVGLLLIPARGEGSKAADEPATVNAAG